MEDFSSCKVIYFQFGTIFLHY